MHIFITGGMGLISVNFEHDWVVQLDESVVNLAKLNHTSSNHNLEKFSDNPAHVLAEADTGVRETVVGLLFAHDVRALVHFAV